MPRIVPVEYETAQKEVKEQFDDQIQKNGRITNMKKTLLHSLPAYRALMEWYPLHEEISKFLSKQEINFFCYAISTENDCNLCSTFFRKILKDANIDFHTFQFSEKEQVLVDFGRDLVKNNGKINDELFARVKNLWTDSQIVSITAFATIMIATNLVNTSLKVELDGYLSGY